MKIEYKVVIFPEDSALVELKKRTLDYSKQLKLLEPSLNDPCITMKTSFMFESGDVKKLEDAVGEVADQFYKFPVEIKKIDSYLKREFHYKIEPSKELKKMHIELISNIGSKCLVAPAAVEGKIFNFTIPLIYGDLHTDDYDKAALILESYYPDLKFQVDNLSLLRKEGKFWRIQKQFFLTIK